MQLGQENSGMQTQTQVMLKLVRNNTISRETAIQFSNRQDELRKML